MTIRTKLAIALFAILALLVTPLAVAYRSLQRVHDSTILLRDREFGASLLLGRVRGGMEELRRAETALLFVHDAGSRDAMSRAIANVIATTDSLAHYQLDSAARDIRAAITDVALVAPEEYRVALDGKTSLAERISTLRVIPAMARVERALGVAESSLRERTRLRVERTAADVTESRRVAALSALVALILAGLIAAWLLRAISRPVQEMERGMHAISDGEFDYRLAISPHRHDEFGRLAASFQSMARQLKELDKLKAEFLSVASHELKTPINVILGYVQLLDEGVFGETSAKQKEILRTLKGQADSLARLTKHLLDIGRFEAGGATVNPRPIELRAFLVELETAFRVLAQQRGVELRVTWADDAPHEVQWDADRMSEVLGNLLGNAVKFTPKGGSVTLHVEPAGDGVSIDVRDTGVGIPPDQLPRIFEKFYQASNQAGASQRGTGLGLSIAKSIVEAHKGTIVVDSTPGVGTVFTLLLPLRVSGRRSTAQRAAASAYSL
jgi:signal transduction histidine kinase